MMFELFNVPIYVPSKPNLRRFVVSAPIKWRLLQALVLRRRSCMLPWRSFRKPCVTLWMCLLGI